jgi:hypothetical protein
MVCLTALAHGQQGSVLAVGQAVLLVQPGRAPTELQKKMKTRVSVDFREALIEDVIELRAAGGRRHRQGPGGDGQGDGHADGRGAG